jgi:hypothetical protein
VLVEQGEGEGFILVWSRDAQGEGRISLAGDGSQEAPIGHFFFKVNSFRRPSAKPSLNCHLLR